MTTLEYNPKHHTYFWLRYTTMLVSIRVYSCIAMASTQLWAACIPSMPPCLTSVHVLRCPATGKKRNKANSVTFSNKHSRKWQDPNLQYKKVFWARGQRWVSLRICTRAIKTLEKNGLDAMAAEAGIDLWKLPFEDARPERLAYLEQNKGKVPQVSP